MKDVAEYAKVERGAVIQWKSQYTGIFAMVGFFLFLFLLKVFYRKLDEYFLQGTIGNVLGNILNVR